MPTSVQNGHAIGSHTIIIHPRLIMYNKVVYLMFFLKVLYSSETLAIVWGVGERLVLLDPLQLPL